MHVNGNSRPPSGAGRPLYVPCEKIRTFKGQPRDYFNPETLSALGHGIKKCGQIQPIIVIELRPPEDGFEYELVDGERRLKGHIAAGISTIAVFIDDRVKNKRDQFRTSFIANMNKESHTCLEVARAIKRMYDEGESVENIALYCGKKSSAYVYQHLSLLKLDPRVLTYLSPETPEERRIPFSTALLLVKLPPAEQIGLAEMIVSAGLSMANAAHLVKNRLSAHGIHRGDRASKEFASIGRFFERTNDGVERFLDYGDERLDALFQGRRVDEIRKLIRAAKDCADNLGAVLKALQKYEERRVP